MVAAQAYELFAAIPRWDVCKIVSPNIPLSLCPFVAEVSLLNRAKIYGKKRWKKQDAESVEEENEDGEEADEDEYAHSADIDGSFLPQDEPSTITTISPISNRYTLRHTDKKSSASRMPSREFFRLGKATTHQNHAPVVAQAMPSTVVLEDEADLQGSF